MGLVSFLSVTQYNCLIMKPPKKSVQVLLDVLRRVRGSKLGKTGGPAGCDRCQAVGGWFRSCYAKLLAFWSQQLTNKGSYQPQDCAVHWDTKSTQASPCMHTSSRKKQKKTLWTYGEWMPWPMTMIYKFISSHSPHQPARMLQVWQRQSKMVVPDSEVIIERCNDQKTLGVFFSPPIAWVKWAFCLNKMCHKKRKQDSFRMKP